MRRYLTTSMVLAFICSVAARAEAQQRDEWELSVAPYLWATALDGEMTAGPRTVPIFLKFSDAADHVSTALAFHAEVSKGRWGVLSDLYLVQLSSSTAFEVLGQRIDGDVELDNVIFEVGGSYLVKQNPRARVAVIGGLRTYTVSPTLRFRAPNNVATPIDTSETSADVFVGVTVRSRISEKWGFIGRGDIGGGNADFTWSALAALEVRAVAWGSVEFGFKALGIDLSRGDRDDRIVTEYSVTHYGPIAGFRFHW